MAGSCVMRSVSDWAGAGVLHAASTRSHTHHAAARFRYPARMRLKISRLDSTIALPTYGTDASAGFDLAAAQDLTIAPGQIALIRTGLIIEVPVGYFLAIFARSSTPLKRGLMVANGVGVVDPDYCGPTDEILIQVLNISTAEIGRAHV